MTEFLTVGIDVGTTSTHLSFSRLVLGNTSRPNEPVRMAVIERITVYQSPIFRTPLADDGSIDAPAVVALVWREYAAAGIAPADVATGAVIITGETAKKRNAESIVGELSSMAGDLVAASAGAELESILAARGSGACAASLDGQNILNVDIGGGTTNFALCCKGKVVRNWVLPLGGRVCDLDTVPAAAITIRQKASGIDIDRVVFSGGVAAVMQCLLDGHLLKDDAFGDCGVLLARALLAELKCSNIQFSIAPSAIRATVIGAGAYSLELSGSTVALTNCNLPLRNVPIVRVATFRDMVRGIMRHRQQYPWQPCAIQLTALPIFSYEQLKRFADDLIQCYTKLEVADPFVILMQRDMAAALGQVLSAKLPGKALIVLDGIGTEYGDYIDIGQPMSNGQFVPVVVKELVFAVD